MVDKLTTDSNKNKKIIKPKQYENFSLLFQYNNNAYDANILKK